MTLAAGTRFGPYEIVGPLGVGGMGEVYRARDSRLDRAVAIKVLPAAFSRDPERLRRFEQEARAAAALNHPNIIAVYDIGTQEQAPYVVTELLEGETLRYRINSGALSVRKATDYALQIARGLAAAHDRGIVHRDLKPENIFTTKDGRIKILDFGLAKLTRPQSDSSGADTPTLASQTEPGLVLGTVGYMSPEQVRGKPADVRSDIFSLGAILYEMVSGTRAFHGDTAADTATAILMGEPPPLSDIQQHVPPGLARIVQHCLEKDPDNRFQSARDVGFSLDAFSGSSSTGTTPLVVGGTELRWQRRKLMVGLGIGLLAVLISFVAGRKTAPVLPQPAFHQLTFQRGYVEGARFAPDGETIIYAASWAGKPMELFSARPEGTESRPLALTDADVMAISSGGELAIRLTPRKIAAYITSGTLARVMLSGGTPRPIEDGIQFADWAPDGKRLAIVRRMAGRSRLEFPPGTVLYETAGWVADPRFSPKGDRIAFIDHPNVGGDPGSIIVTDLAGHRSELSKDFVSAQGLAWSSQSDEVWFTATRVGVARALYGVSLRSEERLLTRIPGILTLLDVSRNGRVLLTRDDVRMGIIASAPGVSKEQDLSWMDFSAVRDFSRDGRLLLFDESGEAGGILGAIYLRKMDGSPPVRLGDGTATSLSSDSKWVLSVPGQVGNQFVLLPTGTGAPRTLAPTQINFQWANLMPNGHQILIAGNEPGHATRIYLQDVSDGKLRPIAPEGVAIPSYAYTVSPDSSFFLAVEADGSSSLRSVESGERKPLPSLNPGELAFGWTGNGRSVYVYQPSIPARVYQVELASGHRQLWRELNPPDPAGVVFIRPPHISADGKAYAYNYNRILSDLYIVDGLH